MYSSEKRETVHNKTFIHLKKPETNPETLYVNEKVQVILECSVSLER